MTLAALRRGARMNADRPRAIPLASRLKPKKTEEKKQHAVL
jgi:hypothetical protein